MMNTPDDLPSRLVSRWPRRRLLAALAALASTPAVAQREQPGAMHFPFGAVTPVRPIPPCPVVTHEGRATDLAMEVRGRWTAAQLIFTGCSAICPIQGALFGQVQRELKLRALPVRLLSISIDPMGDTPGALAKWLRQFDQGAGWLAVAPQVKDVARIVDVLGSGGESVRNGTDVHSGQVFVIDPRGALVYRTASMPPAGQLMAVLDRLSRPA